MSNLGIGEADIFFAKDLEGNLYFCDTSFDQNNVDSYPVNGSAPPQFFNIKELKVHKKPVTISNKKSNLKIFINDDGQLLLGTYDFYKTQVSSCCYHTNGNYYIVNPKEKLNYAPPNLEITIRLY